MSSNKPGGLFFFAFGTMLLALISYSRVVEDRNKLENYTNYTIGTVDKYWEGRGVNIFTGHISHSFKIEYTCIVDSNKEKKVDDPGLSTKYISVEDKFLVIYNKSEEKNLKTLILLSAPVDKSEDGLIYIKKNDIVTN